jgi:hypothetical protein
MVLILLNILALFGLSASNNFGQDLLKTVSGSFCRITEDIQHGSGVPSGDQLLQEVPPEIGCGQ